MKHILLLAIVLSFLLPLFIGVSDAFAASDPNALQISQIEVTQEAGSILLHMTLDNTGNAGIDEFAVALAFFDADGNRIFGYDSTLEGFTDEICNWYYTPEETIPAGDSYLTEDVFSNYEGTVIIGAAIRYYHIEGGTYVLLPESGWQWVYPDTQAERGDLPRTYYNSPADSLYDTLEDFSLGYTYYLLDDYNAFYYGKNQGGEWITQIDTGSPAAEAGLTVGDLILSAGGIKPTENLYAVEYAMADVVAGEAVDWEYERDGVVYVTRIQTP